MRPQIALFGSGLFVAIIASTAAMTAPSTALAQITDEGQISVGIEAPPTLLPGLGAELLDADSEVIAGACSATGDDSARIDVTCPDLDEGQYEVRLTGIPDGAVEVLTCADQVATPTPPDAIGIREVVGPFSCSAIVSMPGIVSTASFGDRLASDFVVVGDDGIDRRGSCEITGDPALESTIWCSGLPAGDYAVEAAEPPSGYAIDAPDDEPTVQCYDLRDPPRDNGRGSVSISDEQPLWVCERPAVSAPLRIQFTSTSNEGDERPWFEAARPVVSDLDGVDRSDQCVEMFRESRVITDRITYDCPGLAAGDYVIDFPGVPDRYEVIEGCDLVRVAESVFAECRYGVRVAQTDPEPDLPIAPPDDELPATGPHNLLLVSTGAVLIVAGIGLLGFSITPRRHRRTA